MKNKNKNTIKHDGPGRPSYAVKWPNRKFTMADLMEENGVSLTTGKGKSCTKLTLVKALKRDLAKKGKSFIVKLDETREPGSTSGLGRKAYVYMRRSKLDTLKTASKSTASVNVGTSRKTRPAKISAATENYETTKAAILAPAAAIVPAEIAPGSAPLTEPATAIQSEATDTTPVVV